MNSAEFSGSLRENIRIERPLSVRDALGGASEETELVGEFRAAIEAAGNGAEAQAESRSSRQRWRFTLRQSDAILPGDKIRWNDLVMMIQTVLVEHRPVPRTILLAEETQ